MGSTAVILTFNLQPLAESLETLSACARSAFAAACAERLAPCYAAVTLRDKRGDPEMLEAALHDLWQNLKDGEPAQARLQQHVDLCEEFLKTEQDIEGWLYAEDAVASTSYAIESWLTGKARDAALAAKRGIDLVETHLIECFDLDISEQEDRARIDTDPLTQAELHRQQRDLMDLAGVQLADAHGSAVIAIVRDRAGTDALRFLDRDAALKYLGEVGVEDR
jgi:uncharacterized protein YjaG (DUF416 family)